MKLNNRGLYRGLNLMYIGELITMMGFIGIVLLILPNTVILGILTLLASFVGMIVSAVGLFLLHSEHRDYRNALVVLAASFVCAIIAKCATGPLSKIMDLAASVLGLVRVYCVIHATNAFLDAVGREDLQTEGKRAFCASAITRLVSLVSSILTAMIAEEQVRAATHLMISSLAMIVSGVLYLIYLKHSSEVLRWMQARSKKAKR